MKMTHVKVTGLNYQSQKQSFVCRKSEAAELTRFGYQNLRQTQKTGTNEPITVSLKNWPDA